MKTKFAKQYGVVCAVFLLIDLVWLLLISPNLYKKYLGYLMREKVQVLPAILFYLIFVGALCIFVIAPGEKEDRASKEMRTMILKGMFFGLVTYGTYDLTNQATIEGWPTLITFLDLIWGMTVTGATTGVSLWLIKKLKIN